jgi:hypothetical protein
LIVAAVAAAKARWPEAERAIPLIVMQQEGGVWQGRSRNARQARVDVAYSTVTGLTMQLAQEL